MKLWHQRYGHLNVKQMKESKSANSVYGLHFSGKGDFTCETCIKAKQIRAPFPKQSETKSEQILALLHSDICVFAL